jgi:thiol-disulfide isomerase/thioredoxin
MALATLNFGCTPVEKLTRVGSIILVCCATGMLGCNNNKIDSSQFQAAKGDASDSTNDSNQSVVTVDKSKPDTVQQPDQNQSQNSGTDLPADNTKSDQVASTDHDQKQPEPGAEKNMPENPDTGVARKTDFAQQYEVPAGGTNELLIFLGKLEQKKFELAQDPVKNREELIALHRARLEASEVLVEVPELEFDATRTKLDAMILMKELDVPGMDKSALEYGKTMSESANSDVADLGHLYLLSQIFRKAVETQTEENKQLFDEQLKMLIRERRESLTIFSSIEGIARQLAQDGAREDAMRTMKIIIDGYADSTTPQIVATTLRMAEQVLLLRAEYDVAFAEFYQDPSKPDAFVQKGKALLNMPGIASETFGNLYRAASVLEAFHHYDAAKEIYSELKRVYAEHKNRDLAAEAVRISDKGITRIDLVGKKPRIEGVTLSGQPIDWDYFRNKTVILNFWRMDNQFSVETIQALEQFASDNSSKGIELVGVNIDNNPELVVRRFAGRSPSWTMVLTSDLNKTGVDSPMAVRFGIVMAPYTILIDKQGTVAEIALYGDDLEQSVANLLDSELKGINGPVKPKKAGAAVPDKTEGSNDSDKADQENKSDQAKPGEVKPAETKPAETKPADAKSADQEADQSDAAETKNNEVSETPNEDKAASDKAATVDAVKAADPPGDSPEVAPAAK